MRYLTTAAMALALAASAAVASADPQDNHDNDAAHASGRGSHDGGTAGQGGHGGSQGGPAAAATHAVVAQPGGPAGGHVMGDRARTVVVPGGGGPGAYNGQGGGAGAQNFRGYGRGPGGYVAPTGPGASASQGEQFRRGAGPGNGFQGDQGGQFHGGSRDWNGQGGHDRGGNGNWNGQGGQFRGGAGNGFAGGQHGGVLGGDHALRGRDQGRGWFNPDRFPQQFHAERRFHDRWDHRPHGWYERTWSFGDFLPFGWFAPDYYLDYQDYGLPYPPVGCEWVREGSDAVLVDTWTGEVLSVAYGVFW